MQVSVLGLSDIGKIIVEKLLADGHEVVVWDESKPALEELRVEKAEDVVSQKLTITHTLEEQQNLIRKPRVFFSLAPAGEPTETMMTKLSQFTEAGDIIVDGSTSNFKDTNRRFTDFEARGIKFLGIGIVGGVHAVEDGFSLMVGGNQDAYQYIVTLLDSLGRPNGTHTYFGRGGAGHFVQMVHNGVVYGMLQAIGEGVGILSKSEYNLNIPDVVETWQEGGIASSFLLDMTIDAITKDPTISQNDGVLRVANDVKWNIEQAKNTNIPTPVTEASVAFRDKSQYDKQTQDTVVAKIIKAMLEEIS